MSGESYDFCEYVYNPLMRQYQAMMRLMSMLRDSQSDCNDVQCFTTGNDPSNPMQINPGSSGSSFATFLPMLFVWALFVFALFMFRPSSMRGNSNEDALNKSRSSKAKNSPQNNRRRDFRDDRDDDDNSTVS